MAASGFDPRLDNPPPFFEEGEVEESRPVTNVPAPPPPHTPLPPPVPEWHRRHCQPDDQATGNPYGIAGFVLSIVAWVFCFLPVFSLIIGPLGLIFSGIGLSRRPRGLAIAGFVISLIGFLFFIILICFSGLMAYSYSGLDY